MTTTNTPNFYPPLIIDEAPIRQRVLTELEQAEAELDALNHEWAVFCDKDKAAFVQWYNTAFASLHSDLQSLTLEIYKKRILIREVIDMATNAGIDFAEAYQRVIRAEHEKDFLDDLDDEQTAGSDETDDDFDYDSHSRDSHGERPEHNHPERAALPPPEQNVKDLYRALAKKLHPDLIKDREQTVEERGLWFRVQSAYEARDAARLEALLAEASGGEHRRAPRERLSISDILNLVTGLFASVESMRRRIRKARRDRAWGFSRPGGKKHKHKVSRAIQKELEQDVAQSREALDALEEFMRIHFEAEIERVA